MSEPWEEGARPVHPEIAAGWRPVGRQRARKLRRRGEDVRWSAGLQSFVWVMGRDARCRVLACPSCRYRILALEVEYMRVEDKVCPRCADIELRDFGKSPW